MRRFLMTAMASLALFVSPSGAYTDWPVYYQLDIYENVPDGPVALDQDQLPVLVRIEGPTHSASQMYRGAISVDDLVIFGQADMAGTTPSLLPGDSVNVQMTERTEYSFPDSEEVYRYYFTTIWLGDHSDIFDGSWFRFFSPVYPQRPSSNPAQIQEWGIYWGF